MHPVFLHRLVPEIVVFVQYICWDKKPITGLGGIVHTVDADFKCSAYYKIEFVLAKGVISLVPPFRSYLGSIMAALPVNGIQIQKIKVLQLLHIAPSMLILYKDMLKLYLAFLL